MIAPSTISDLNSLTVVDFFFKPSFLLMLEKNYLGSSLLTLSIMSIDN